MSPRLFLAFLIAPATVPLVFFAFTTMSGGAATLKELSGVFLMFGTVAYAVAIVVGVPLAAVLFQLGLCCKRHFVIASTLVGLGASTFVAIILDTNISTLAVGTVSGLVAGLAFSLVAGLSKANTRDQV